MDQSRDVPVDLGGQEVAMETAPVHPIHQESPQIGGHEQMRGQLDQGQGQEVAPAEAMSAMIAAANDPSLQPQVI